MRITVNFNRWEVINGILHEGGSEAIEEAIPIPLPVISILIYELLWLLKNMLNGTLHEGGSETMEEAISIPLPVISILIYVLLWLLNEEIKKNL